MYQYEPTGSSAAVSTRTIGMTDEGFYMSWGETSGCGTLAYTRMHIDQSCHLQAMLWKFAIMV